MSAMRKEYFKDLIKDCVDACDEMNIAEEDAAPIIAALIQSDSFNGVRKAMMTPNYIAPRNGQGPTHQF